jgi:hypothetical protein
MVDLLTVILAGVAATLVMTGFSQITAYLLKKNFYVVIILATMLPFNKHVTPPKLSTYVAATILHYLIGIVFAYVHLGLILNGYIANNALSALLYGGVIGTIAIIGWRLFFMIHPNPPSVERTYFVMIWIGHIWLSITAAAIFWINPLSTPAIENL